MISLMRSSIALTLLLAACGVCNAVEVLKREPPFGAPPGDKFLVDDGTCGPGKIKEVTIGDWSTGNHEDNRKRKCIARK